MNELDRRQFLSRAVLGGASVVSATSLGVLAPGLTPDEAGAEPLDGPDPNFAEGRVVSISGSILLVASSEFLVRRIQLANTTRVWKARFTSADEIRVDDRLYARGVPAQNGLFLAETVWVNIVNVHVEIARVGRDRLELNHSSGRLVGRLRGDTVAAYNLGPATSDLSRLRPRLHVQLIGAWHPNTNEIDVATIYAPV